MFKTFILLSAIFIFTHPASASALADGSFLNTYPNAATSTGVSNNEIFYINNGTGGVITSIAIPFNSANDARSSHFFFKQCSTIALGSGASGCDTGYDITPGMWVVATTSGIPYLTYTLPSGYLVYSTNSLVFQLNAATPGRPLLSSFVSYPQVHCIIPASCAFNGLTNTYFPTILLDGFVTYQNNQYLNIYAPYQGEATTSSPTILFRTTTGAVEWNSYRVSLLNLDSGVTRTFDSPLSFTSATTSLPIDLFPGNYDLSVELRYNDTVISRARRQFGAATSSFDGNTLYVPQDLPDYLTGTSSPFQPQTTVNQQNQIGFWQTYSDIANPNGNDNPIFFGQQGLMNTFPFRQLIQFKTGIDILSTAPDTENSTSTMYTHTNKIVLPLSEIDFYGTHATTTDFTLADLSTYSSTSSSNSTGLNKLIEAIEYLRFLLGAAVNIAFSLFFFKFVTRAFV